MHWSKVMSSSASGCKTFSMRCVSSCLVSIFTLINNYKSRHLLLKQETVTWVQLSVVALKFLFHFKAVLLVKLKSCVIACLHMQTHFLDLACSDTVFNYLLEHLRSYSISFVRGQHRYCHYVADVLFSVLFYVLFAANCTD